MGLYWTRWEPVHGWQHIEIPLKLDEANTSGEFTNNKDNMARPCGGLEARLRKPLGNTEAFPVLSPPCNGEKWPPEAHTELTAPLHSGLESWRPNSKLRNHWPAWERYLPVPDLQFQSKGRGGRYGVRNHGGGTLIKRCEVGKETMGGENN